MAIPELQQIGYTRKPVIKRDLSTFAKGMETLTARHQAAIQQQSAIDNQLAQVELNEQEDEWKFNYASNIKSKIDEEAQLGNYAGALTTAVKEAGSAFSNPALIGRIRANQNYKQFQSELGQRKNVDEDTKARFKEMNVYKYEDKFDENGNIVGGTNWQPIATPVDQIDTYKLMQTARINTAKEAGGGNTIYYMDEQGNFTPDLNKSVDGLPYISKENKYEALTKDKLRKGIDAAIAATPGASESIKQDWETAVWKTKKQQAAAKDNKTPIITEATDDKGILLTEKQYIDKMVDPFLVSATYFHNFPDTKALAGLSAEAARLRAKVQKARRVSMTDATKTKAGYYEKQVATASGVFAQKGASRQGLSQIAKSFGVQVKSTAGGDSIFEAIKKQSERTGKPIPKEAIDLYTKYKEQSDKFDEMVPPGTSEKQRQALEFTSALDSGVDLSQIGDNDFAKKYVKELNKVFGESDKVYFSIPQGVLVKDIITKLDGTELGSHRNLGVTVDRDDKGIYISLDRENMTNYYLVNKVVREFKPSTFETIMGQGKNYGNILRSTSDGRKESIEGLFTKRAVSSDIYDEANKLMSNFVQTNGTTRPANVHQTSVGLDDVTMQYAKNNGYEETQIKALQKSIDNNLATYQPQMGEMYFGKVGEVRKGIENGQDRANIYAAIEAIRSTDPSRITYSIDDKTLGTIITVAPDAKKEANTSKIENESDIDVKHNEGFTLYIPDLIDSNVKNMILSSPQIKAKSTLYNNVLSGFGKTPLGDNESLFSEDGVNYRYDMDNGQSLMISEDTAASLLQHKDYVNNLRYMVYQKGGQDNLSEEEAISTVNGIVNNYRTMFNLGNIPLKQMPPFIINKINNELRLINTKY